MGVDQGRVAGVIARGSANADNLQKHEVSPWDVWTNTARGVNAAQGSPGGIRSTVTGLGHTATAGVSHSSGSQAGSAIAAQAGSTWEMAKQLVGEGDKPGPEGVLGKVGGAFALLTSAEQMLSAALSVIPFPAFPALRILDMDFGLPHIHNHPPNVVPPAPPIPLPSTGPIIPIPILSGATHTLINGMPAARCGDIGLAIWCGGYFPMYEVYLGSATVWIEGARAGRLLVDITKHCTFSSPKPSDPPTGPMFGTTISGSSNVLIGGIPMPSLTAMVIGAAIKGIFKGIGKVFRKLTAKSFIQRLLDKGVIVIEDGGNAAFRQAVMKDLEKMAESAAGRMLLRDLEKSFEKIGQGVVIAPLSAGAKGPFCRGGWAGIHPSAHPNGTGQGCGSRIEYDPSKFPNPKAPGTPSDVVLFHEMNHAANNAAGRNMDSLKSGDPAWDRSWTNWEEHNTVNAENGYRRDQGLPQRKDYRHIP
ncbi:MAG TPA: M91 family zinc metallopeptidase [Longimicrobiales bacterium]|nr:M91 family zinc metallopeptidase [Longimicrobiales bacterium]